MPRKKKVVPLPIQGADIDSIVALSRGHHGFAKLSPTQRRLLIAAVLAAVVPRDGKVLDVELQHFLGHLKTEYQFSASEKDVALGYLKGAHTEEALLQAAQQLPELLNADDRATLIGLMWDIACADQELHPSESELIFKIADKAGVVRKRAVDEQIRAARANGVKNFKAG